MRIALVLSLLIAILAVVFALQNPAYIDVNLGPFDLTGSTALVLMITFCAGVLVGILATVPSVVKRRKRIRELERHAADARLQQSTSGTGSHVPDEPAGKSSETTKYSS